MSLTKPMKHEGQYIVVNYQVTYWCAQLSKDEVVYCDILLCCDVCLRCLLISSFVGFSIKVVQTRCATLRVKELGGEVQCVSGDGIWTLYLVF